MTQPIKTICIGKQGLAGPAGLYPQAQWQAESAPYVRGTVLAHSNGVWLALRDNAVEPSASVPDDWASWFDFGDLVNGVATLDGSGKVPTEQLPALAITNVFAVASQAAMLALTAETGDIAVRSDVGKSFVLADAPATTLANWVELLAPTGGVLSVAGLTGAVGGAALKTALSVSASDVSGLGAMAALDAGAGLTSSGGSLSANVTSVAGRTGAVTLTSSDIAHGILVAGVSCTASSHTGDTSEFVLATISIPAMPAGAILRFTLHFSGTSNGNGKTVKAYFGAVGSGTGGTPYVSISSLTTNIVLATQRMLLNRTTSSQVCTNLITNSNTFAGTSALTSSSVNTAAGTELTITGMLTNAADTITLEGYLIELILP